MFVINFVTEIWGYFFGTWFKFRKETENPVWQTVWDFEQICWVPQWQLCPSVVCYGTVVCVVGVLLLPEVQPQDRVQKAVWQAAQTPGGHQQAACADCQCEHPQAWDTATQSWYTACAVGLSHTDGAVAGTDDTDNWCNFRGFCSGCCSDVSVLSYCTVWDCELVVEGRAARIFLATEYLKTDNTCLQSSRTNSWSCMVQ